MNAEMLQARFARIGARMQLGRNTSGRSSRLPLTLDVQSDGGGEFFDIRMGRIVPAELDVVDLRRRERHLVLRAREHRGEHYYLCGHDEAHWFVAAIPERAGAVRNVFEAMEALKPDEVLEAQRRQGIKGKDRRRRKNAAYVRQGEWFFLPAPRLHVEKTLIVRNEPFSRGNGSKPHLAEFLYRKGGEEVYVCQQHPQGLSVPEYLELMRNRPRTRTWNWRRMFRNPESYVLGKISHPDHKTVNLCVWHKVAMNTENQSQAMSHVVFLD